MPTPAARLIRELQLQPHPEGGHYREIHRSSQTVLREGTSRVALTVIHFLLQAEEQSRWHVVAADEVWHFSAGSPLELITFDPRQEQFAIIQLGSLEAGGAPLHVVPAGVWQAARSLGDYSLASCIVGPGFDFADFQFVVDLPEHQQYFTGPLVKYRSLL